MHTFFNTKLSSPKETLIKLGNPPGDYQHHQFLKPLQLNPKSPLHHKLSLLTDKYVQDTKGDRGSKQLEVYRCHWQWVLLGLARSLLSNNWLLVSLDSKAYSSDIWLKRYQLKYASIKAIKDHLEEQGLIEVLRGKRYKDQPSRTRIYPSKALASVLWEYAVATEEAIEGPYLRLNEGDSKWREVLFDLDEDHPDLADMIAINEFLKDHQWAAKGPVSLIYKNSPFEGGRLYTAFQNLSDRRTRVRINTLIDSEPICEVDFSANHLRMNLAINAKLFAGDNPYEDICEIAGVIPRDRVKEFITVAMGANDEKSGFNALRQKGFNDEFSNMIYKATLQRYPKLQFFNGWGTNLQSLEGQILKDVMFQGLQEGIVCLPVHDAIAAQQEHKDWAVETMKHTWTIHLDGCPTRVTVDMP